LQEIVNVVRRNAGQQHTVDHRRVTPIKLAIRNAVSSPRSANQITVRRQLGDRIGGVSHQ
jgi:hypothetical protein